MGNDDFCWIKKIGTIHFKMHNRVVKTLIEVQYVLDLQKNLSHLKFQNPVVTRLSCMMES